MHQQARTCATDLALIEPDRVDQAFDCGIDIGVVEHDECRLATQFQRQLFTASGGLFADAPTHGSRAGKGNLIHIGLYDHLADSAITGNDVDNAPG